MLICDSRLEGSTSVFPLLFQRPRSHFPHSTERGLQQHHSNHFSAEIHLSTLSLSNISVFLPSGKIKYLVLHSEIHSEVLSQFHNPWRSFFFSLLKPIISHKIKGIYLPFTEDKLVAVGLPTHTHEQIRFHVGTQNNWNSNSMSFSCNTNTITDCFFSLFSHLSASSLSSTGVSGLEWRVFFPACHWLSSITGPLCPQQAGPWLWFSFLLYR